MGAASITLHVIDFNPRCRESACILNVQEPAMTLPSNLLRFALIADAVASGATGLLMLGGAGFLAGLLGLPTELLRYAGLALLAFVVFVGFVGTRAEISRTAAALIVVINAAWVVGSVLLLLSGWVAPTTLGYAFVLAQAAAVAVLAELQWIGLRRQAIAV
jgi:hypothetical protein